MLADTRSILWYGTSSLLLSDAHLSIVFGFTNPSVGVTRYIPLKQPHDQ